MQDVLCSRAAGAMEIQRSARCAQKWATATAAQARAVVPRIVKRVIVRDNLIELQLSRSAIREVVTGVREPSSLASNSSSTEDLVILEAEATVSKCRGKYVWFWLLTRRTGLLARIHP